VISLFMSGGVSHIDTFDPKPALTKYAGQPLDSQIGGDVIVRQGYPGPLMPSPFQFKKYGQSGIEVSELFPQVGGHVDDIAFVRSVYGQSNDHVQATYEMQTGQTRMGFPSVGSWVTYGLGSENASLPGYVVLHDARGGPLGGVNDWTSGFIPAAYQGTLFRSTGDPIVDLKPPAGVSAEEQRTPPQPAGEAERARHAAVPGQHRARRANLVLRARVPDAELRAGRARHQQGVGSDAQAVRPRREGDRAVRPPVPDGTAAGRARRALRAAVPRRHGQPEHRHLGRARRRQGQPHPARRRIGSSDCRSAHRSQGTRPARFDAGRLARRVRPHADLTARRRARITIQAR
jgi:hypothetical protein